MHSRLPSGIWRLSRQYLKFSIYTRSNRICCHRSYRVAVDCPYFSCVVDNVDQLLPY